MDVLNVLAAIVGFASAAFAVWVYVEQRRKAATERSRVAAQQERLRMALATTSSCLGAADLIVQRSKQDDVSVVELQNIARVLRGSLGNLARQIEAEDQVLAHWEFGKSFYSVPSPPGPAGIADDGTLT
ncbi:hypothetical protein [Micromonospora coxensis]|uniref:Acyl-CoA dehydrogenase, C-terminal domain n=1 Tax=Micromonospora coxensis TaxID=356852 RepID=A0A1C5K080_9ACTN|nr:hypothetical protein [Micromonospora coxensis]SCG76202.1 Acyl-CoA dehydrogenase, C-terminal domain [Micromonospora coxensis]